jgi:2-hydroxychromene-2-carboxylate isomerase
MAAALDFYFDFSSPYGYIAAEKIEALAAKHGRAVAWRPILLGVVFRTTGASPLPQIPLKGEYSKRDFARSARFHGLPFRMPSVFPVSGVPGSRAFYWLEERDGAQAVAFARALYRAFFADDVNIGDVGNVIRVGTSLGIDAATLEDGMNDAATKERTRREVEAAVAKGVFGSPTIVVDGEPFWGVDRFDQIERWLASGPF